jgi:small subunit ribosomal protein S8
MSIDTIGNFLTIIRNGVKLGRKFVVTPHSRITESIALILKEEGFVQDVIIEEDTFKTIKIYLRYHNNESAIHILERTSTPGRRFYTKAKNLKPVKGNLGIAILSTNRGIMTDKQAKQLVVGGELLCSVW